MTHFKQITQILQEIKINYELEEHEKWNETVLIATNTDKDCIIYMCFDKTTGSLKNMAGSNL